MALLTGHIPMGRLQRETSFPFVVEPWCRPERVQGVAILTNASVVTVLELVTVG